MFSSQASSCDFLLKCQRKSSILHSFSIYTGVTVGRLNPVWSLFDSSSRSPLSPHAEKHGGVSQPPQLTSDRSALKLYIIFTISNNKFISTKTTYLTSVILITLILE